MTGRNNALNLLRRSVNNPMAVFRDGQWEALTLTGRKDVILHDRDAACKAVLIAQPFKDCLLYTSPSPRDRS